MPIRLGRGMLWSTNAAVAAVASCCCVVMNLCYQVSHGPFCVASSTALLKLVMLLKNHISAAIRDKYEEAARWLLYTYPSYIFSLSAGHMGSCSSTSLFFCSSTGGLEFANFDNRGEVLHRVSRFFCFFGLLKKDSSSLLTSSSKSASSVASPVF